jgi:hypothetical protein
MPINVGRKGFAGIVAIPGKRFGAAQPNKANQLNVSTRPFRSTPFSTKAFTITGVTKDSAGVALGGCTVDLMLTASDTKVDTQVSDGSGNYSFGATGGPYYIVAYKKGVPDVAGTTVDTLTGS